MKLGVMQPYFFPYIGYYTIMKHTDKYIYLDNVQYIKHGWINRNRILKIGGGWQYITIPIKSHSHDTPIHEIEIDNSQSWQKKILNQLTPYKKFAPYYPQVNEIVENLFGSPYRYISELNVQADKLIMNYLGIKTETEILSESNLKYEKPESADEWGLNLCLAVEGVDEYRNTYGGKDFFDAEKYAAKGIKLRFVKNNLPPYPQRIRKKYIPNTFEPGLSVLDVLMFNSPEQVNAMIDDFIFV